MTVNFRPQVESWMKIWNKETFNKKDRDRIIVGFGFWAGFGTVLGIGLTTVLERELAYYVAATAFIATIISNVLR